MAVSADERTLNLIADRLVPLADAGSVDAIVADLADKRVVMLGECTHGTAEFYAIRRWITQALVRDHGFRILALEADWPEARSFHRVIRERDGERTEKVLREPRRWPTWMWANTEISHLLDWLLAFNRNAPENRKADVYGLDLYSLFESIDTILKTVRRTNPSLADALAARYECFDQFERDEHSYARSLQAMPAGCRREVLKNLQDLLGLRLGRIHLDEAELFDVQQNARIVTNAEHYYRSMIDADDSSWNIRDRHMLDTLKHLLERDGPGSKTIVWAHNTHIGDYRATTMIEHGYVNLGGLVREDFGDDQVALLGFSTYRGSVLAAPHWEGEILEMDVPPARENSYDDFFERAGRRKAAARFYLPLRSHRAEFDGLPRRAQRAIGVVYDPYNERFSNYVPTQLEKRYDGIVFVSETRALKQISVPETHEHPPITWPTGV